MTSMSKCGACGATNALWALQPWGPGEKAIKTTLGAHYRGFRVVKLCALCAENLEAEGSLVVLYKGKPYTVSTQR